MYNDLLKLKLAEFVGIANDVGLTETGKHKDEVEYLISESVTIAENLIHSVGLSLACLKTEMVLISGNKKNRNSIYQIPGSHDKINFQDRKKNDKASKKLAGLLRLLPSIRGPRSSKRKLLTRVVTSTILYDAPNWAKSLDVKSYCKTLEFPHRRCALRIICGDRKIIVISGPLPIEPNRNTKRCEKLRKSQRS